jgi:Predicted Co/Zn/Cd cation transporters
MSIAQRPPPRALPLEQSEALQRAERLCRWTLLWMSLVSITMYLAMGGSQAMKTALVEDVLSLVPSIAFLVASRFRRKGVDEEYITGRERAFDINFLISSVALTGVGLALVYDGVHTLVTAARPVVGSVVIAGHVLWQGWLMMAVLALSAVPPVILGHKKLVLARKLSLKPLHTDADVSKADWMTAAAGIVGVAGVGMGWWWADAVAALVIAGSILRDGAGNLRAACATCTTRAPRPWTAAIPIPCPHGWPKQSPRYRGWRAARCACTRKASAYPAWCCWTIRRSASNRPRRSAASPDALHWRLDAVVVSLAPPR